MPISSKCHKKIAYTVIDHFAPIYTFLWISSLDTHPKPKPSFSDIIIIFKPSWLLKISIPHWSNTVLKTDTESISQTFSRLAIVYIRMESSVDSHCCVFVLVNKEHLMVGWGFLQFALQQLFLPIWQRWRCSAQGMRKGGINGKLRKFFLLSATVNCYHSYQGG